MTRYYLDTSIWLDLFEDRNSRGKLAAALIEKIIKEDSEVYYSDITITELKSTGYYNAEIRDKYKPFRQILVYASSDRKEMGKAEDISEKRGIPKGDVLHAIIARRYRCILVADDRHFQKLRDILHPKRPTDIIEDDVFFQVP